MPRIELEHHELPYAVAEELNTLRTNIQFSGTDKKVIMFTSCTSGDGKSTLSLELARSLTGLGCKVLLLDTDLRKSRMRNRVIAGEISCGLSHFLAGQRKIEEVVYETGVQGLFVIPAGRYVTNPSELLSGERFEALMDWARAQFDYVIVDCAPLGLVVDAAIVSQHCDGSIFVIAAGKIHRRQAQEVAAKLKNARCPVMGVVLNKIDRKASGYYYYQYNYDYREKYEAPSASSWTRRTVK